MNQEIALVLHALAEDILAALELILDQNGLQNSRLKQDATFRVDVSDNPIVTLFFNEYTEHIEQGRKPRSGKLPPLSDLRQWALQKGIPATNGVLYAIAQTIWREGVAPRPILAELRNRIEESFDRDWADRLLEAIVSELEKFWG